MTTREVSSPRFAGSTCWLALGQASRCGTDSIACTRRPAGTGLQVGNQSTRVHTTRAGGDGEHGCWRVKSVLRSLNLEATVQCNRPVLLQFQVETVVGPRGHDHRVVLRLSVTCTASTRLLRRLQRRWPPLPCQWRPSASPPPLPTPKSTATPVPRPLHTRLLTPLPPRPAPLPHDDPEGASPPPPPRHPPPPAVCPGRGRDARPRRVGGGGPAQRGSAARAEGRRRAGRAGRHEDRGRGLPTDAHIVRAADWAVTTRGGDEVGGAASPTAAAAGAPVIEGFGGGGGGSGRDPLSPFTTATLPVLADLPPGLPHQPCPPCFHPLRRMPPTRSGCDGKRRIAASTAPKCFRRSGVCAPPASLPCPLPLSAFACAHRPSAAHPHEGQWVP